MKKNKNKMKNYCNICDYRNINMINDEDTMRTG